MFPHTWAFFLQAHGLAGSWLDLRGIALFHALRPFLIVVVSFVVLLLIRRILLGRLKHFAAGRIHGYASSFLESVRLPSLLWCFAATLDIALRTLNLTPRQVDAADDWILAFLIISFCMVAAAGMVRTLAIYGARRNLPFANAGLTQTLIYLMVMLLGLAITLQSVFHKSATPLLTALGVGGLAVALALQDTLSNLFAGIHILVENPITVGEFIRLSTGEEGIVSDIGWRTTRLKTGSNNTIVIPNNKVTTTILTNFNMPDRRLSVDVAVIVSVDTDPELLERLCLEEASQTPGVLLDPPPAFLVDPGVVPYYLQCKLAVFVENRLQQSPVQSSLRMRVLKRLRTAGIDLPRHPGI